MFVVEKLVGRGLEIKIIRDMKVGFRDCLKII